MDGGIVDMEGKKPFSFTKWAKSRKGQQVIIYDNSAVIAVCIYLSAFCRDGKIQFL
jgi:hypothetical protein